MRQLSVISVILIVSIILFPQRSVDQATLAVSGTATTTPQASGGLIFGWVYGYAWNRQLVPLAWVMVTASNGDHRFTTSTSPNGTYEMNVPVGLYNLTVSPPGYVAHSLMVSVSALSSSSVSFYLEQSQPPIELQTSTSSYATSTVTSGTKQTTTANSVSSTSVPLLTTTVTQTSSIASGSVSTTTVTATMTMTVTLTMSSTGSQGISSGATYLQISSNSTISNLLFDSQRRLINFTVNGPSGTTGVTSLTFAKPLINGIPSALIDNGNIPPIAESYTSNSTHYSLTFAYHHSTHSISVGGSGPIPEFEYDSAATVFMILAVSLIFVRRRTRLANNAQ